MAELSTLPRLLLRNARYRRMKAGGEFGAGIGQGAQSLPATATLVIIA